MIYQRSDVQFCEYISLLMVYCKCDNCGFDLVKRDYFYFLALVEKIDGIEFRHLAQESGRRSVLSLSKYSLPTRL